MKRLFLFSTLAASLVPALVHAQGEGTSLERLYTVEGVVSRVESNEIEISTDEGDLDFVLDDSVRIFRDGKRVQRSAIQSGDRARASYQESQDGALDDEVLVRLDLKSSPTESPPSEPPPSESP
ncbi:hypothetical protein F0U60_00075 [Archangium minus]|uniref:DUF5666 domain-containing protein n=1 Tax=Archangium minus TaxID=83450 RepID=A0ABY9WFT5_9BACT|nr:hypothetical protein F0U60_00075 [Archangium minus]